MNRGIIYVFLFPERFNGDELWLQRSAILFQLKYKEKTNETLLYRYIRQNTDSKEFFIQKAVGWALREYSKTNPESVKHFIEENRLPKLSIREGSKYQSRITKIKESGGLIREFAEQCNCQIKYQ